MVADPVDNIVLNGTTLLCDGVQAGKSVSEFTSGLKIGRATYDDRQHAFYFILDDFSGGFGHRQLDIREALGTHWDNEGGADLRRARHITLPPKRYAINADTEPVDMRLSSEILDGAAIGVPATSPAAGISSYYYYAAGDTVYRMTESRDALTLVHRFVSGDGIILSGAANEPTKMTRLFKFRDPTGVARLYLVTANDNLAGSSSAMLHTENPGAASPTWVEGVRAVWDAIPAPFGTLGGNIIIGQAITFQFMFSTNPTTGATDWNIDNADAAINPPIWMPHSICRFLGVAVLPQRSAPGLYFIDYGDGRLYALDYHLYKAFPVEIGDYHYLVNGIVWQGNIVVTDGWDIWLYTPGGGGGETVRKIGLWGKDGVPDSLRTGRYRITGLVDGGDQLFAVAERTALDKDKDTATLGFLVFVYNGAGWSQYSPAVEAAGTSTTSAVNPIAAVIDRFPAGVVAAADVAKETSRTLNVLCQNHPDAASTKIQIHSYRLPKIGKIPIDKIDEFEADTGNPHTWRTGWLDGGFRDVKGALFYMKADLQSLGGTGTFKIEYRLDDDETGAFTTLGTVSTFSAPDWGSTTFQFEDTNKSGVEFRTVQFQFTFNRSATSTLSAGINNSVTSIPIADLGDYPDSGVVQIEDEVISYTAKSVADGAGNLTGATRGVRGTDAAAHTSGQGVTSLNRTPEVRALTLVYAKKSKLRKTWVVQVDVDKMVEQKTQVDTNDDGSPDANATHQNVWDFLETIWDKQTLVKLIVPEMEPTADNVRVQVADMVYVQDDARSTSTARGRINLTLIQPVNA